MHESRLVIVENAKSAQEAIDLTEKIMTPYQVDVEHGWEHHDVHSSEITRALQGTAYQGREHEDTQEAIEAIRSCISSWCTGYSTAGTYNRATGTYGYMIPNNPEGRYDWYVIGGRYRGLIKIKDSTPESAKRAPGADSLMESCVETSDLGPNDVAVARYTDIEEIMEGSLNEVWIRGQWEPVGLPADFEDVWESIPETAWVVVVDCHC